MFLPGLDKYLELLNITKRWPKKCESSVFFSDRKVGPTGGWNNKRLLWIADWACIYYLCTYSYGLQIADDEEDDGGGVWSETFPLGDRPTFTDRPFRRQWPSASAAKGQGGNSAPTGSRFEL